MSNLFKQFQTLFGKSPLQIGDVIAVDGDVATVQLAGAGIAKARGPAEVGQKVFVRNGVLEGQAPELPVVPIEI